MDEQQLHSDTSSSGNGSSGAHSDPNAGPYYHTGTYDPNSFQYKRSLKKTAPQNPIKLWMVILGFIFGGPIGIGLLILMFLLDPDRKSSSDRPSVNSSSARGAALRSTSTSARTVRYQPVSTPTSGASRTAASSAPKTTSAPRTAGTTAKVPETAAAGSAKSLSEAKRMRKIRPGCGKSAWVTGLLTLGAGAFVAALLLLIGIGDMGLIWGLRQMFLPATVTAACCCIPGGILAALGKRKRDRAARCRAYLTMIGDLRTVSLDTLASAIPTSVQRTRKDLEWMLGMGFFPGCFIDAARGLLTDSLGAVPTPAPKKETPTPVQPEKPADPARPKVYPEEARIRALNDRIQDPYVSERMDRLERLTSRILFYADAHPEKENELRAFRTHYLPTSIKILESYARFEAQGVDGENISGAMKEIEDIMDKLVAGFEKQLDVLYASEALDVTTDITVLENMMDMGGLGPLSPFDPTHSDGRPELR